MFPATKSNIKIFLSKYLDIHTVTLLRDVLSFKLLLCTFEWVLIYFYDVMWSCSVDYLQLNRIKPVCVCHDCSCSHKESKRVQCDVTLKAVEEELRKQTLSLEWLLAISLNINTMGPHVFFNYSFPGSVFLAHYIPSYYLIINENLKH